MYILVGSVTTATRLKKAAEKIIGFPAYVVHTPSALNQGGCSYSVRVDDRALNEIRKIETVLISVICVPKCFCKYS